MFHHYNSSNARISFSFPSVPACLLKVFEEAQIDCGEIFEFPEAISTILPNDLLSDLNALHAEIQNLLPRDAPSANSCLAQQIQDAKARIQLDFLHTSQLTQDLIARTQELHETESSIFNPLGHLCRETALWNDLAEELIISRRAYLKLHERFWPSRMLFEEAIRCPPLRRELHRLARAHRQVLDPRIRDIQQAERDIAFLHRTTYLESPLQIIQELTQLQRKFSHLLPALKRELKQNRILHEQRGATETAYEHLRDQARYMTNTVRRVKDDIANAHDEKNYHNEITQNYAEGARDSFLVFQDARGAIKRTLSEFKDVCEHTNKCVVDNNLLGGLTKADLFSLYSCVDSLNTAKAEIQSFFGVEKLTATLPIFILGQHDPSSSLYGILSDVLKSIALWVVSFYSLRVGAQDMTLFDFFSEVDLSFVSQIGCRFLAEHPTIDFSTVVEVRPPTEDLSDSAKLELIQHQLRNLEEENARLRQEQQKHFNLEAFKVAQRGTPISIPAYQDVPIYDVLERLD